MRTATEATICPTCGEEFRHQHAGRGRPRSYCSEWCQTHARRRGKVSLACQECGVTFEALKSTTRFYSYDCRYLDYRRRGGLLRHKLVCPRCGASFLAERLSRKFCSEACRNDANRVDGSEKTGNHRARCIKFGVPYDPSIRREQVLDRDDWTCWLCGDAIPDDVPYPDGLYGSIDHAIPLAKGGAHSWDNVRAAHLSCNCSRGARDAER